MHTAIFRGTLPVPAECCRSITQRPCRRSSFMLELHSGPAGRNCQGTSRRAAIKAGVLGGFSGLALPQFLRAKEQTPFTTTEKSVILIWLDGGPSQLETYDPKPDAPAEFRGPFGIAKTRTPGVNFS